MWDTVLEVLRKKVKEGVEVRLMYDGTCSISLLPYEYPKQLQGIWNPVQGIWTDRTHPFYQPE